MRIVCLKEVLFNPTRFFLVVWDAASRQFVLNAEWIVHATENNQLMVTRLQGMISFFASHKCVGITSDVQQILKKYKVLLPAGWAVYQTER